MKKKYIAGFIPVLLSVFFSCQSEKKEAKQEVYTVKTDTVRAYNKQLTMAFPGKVRAASDVNLSFRVSGTLLKTYVDAGDAVKKGQLLAEIDPRDYATQLQATEAEYNQIKAEAERIIELYKRNGTSANDHDKAVSGLQQISAKYEAHKNALKDTRLIAPFNGYVHKKYYSADEALSAGMPVFSLISDNKYEIDIYIPAIDYVRRNDFTAFTGEVNLGESITFPLELIDVGRKANANQLYRMRFRIPRNNDMNIAAGMSAEVSITYIPPADSLVIVPLTSAFEQEGETCVWVYNEDEQRVSRRKVTPVEIRKDGYMLLDGDLQAGEIIVTAGVNTIHENMQIKILPAISQTNVGGLL